MQVVKHSPLIYEYKNAVTPAACDELRSELYACSGGLIVDSLKNTIRNNQAVAITNAPGFEEVDAKINLYLGLVHQQYATKNPVVMEYATRQGITTQLRSTYSFRYYNAKDSYEWHCDWNPGIWSVLSYVLYLDDGYTGGDLLFAQQRLRIKPEKGSILAFPADLAHIHKSTKIQSGTKTIVYGNFFKDLASN